MHDPGVMLLHQELSDYLSLQKVESLPDEIRRIFAVSHLFIPLFRTSEVKSHIHMRFAKCVLVCYAERSRSTKMSCISENHHSDRLIFISPNLLKKQTIRTNTRLQSYLSFI